MLSLLMSLMVDITLRRDGAAVLSHILEDEIIVAHAVLSCHVMVDNFSASSCGA